jgi:integrase/recombinase XerD
VSHPSRVRIIGPVVPYAAGFRAELESQGYRPHAVGCQLYVMAHLSRWLAHHSVEVGGLTPERVEEFLVARRAEGYTLWAVGKGSCAAGRLPAWSWHHPRARRARGGHGG